MHACIINYICGDFRLNVAKITTNTEHLSMRSKPIVALIYDFDGTLSPGNMQEFGFIQAIGKKPQEFWQESDDIAVGQDASNILSYMKLMFDEARKAGIKLRRDDFRRFGASVELFDGVREWFGIVNEYGRSCGVKVEHYINSSGLAEMIEGTEIAREFKRIFACSFIYNKNSFVFSLSSSKSPELSNT